MGDVGRGDHGESLVLSHRTLLSRSIVVRLESLEPDEVGRLIDRACREPRGLAARWELQRRGALGVGPVVGRRRPAGLTALEAAAGATTPGGAIDAEAVAQAVQSFAPAYDRDGDAHYDVMSALIKSVRGSDVDAALHYLARMVVAGEDPRFIARRLVILASEDVGMADPRRCPPPWPRCRR